jgi:hypothetical protein
MVFRCWRARISVGGGEQRHHGLAGADIALQQPQHAQRLGEVAGDGRCRLLLRGGERIRQRIDHLAPQMPVTGIAYAGGPPQLRAHQRERQLSRQQLVIGEAAPERPLGQDVFQRLRHVDARQRLGERGKLAATDDFGADPFRHLRNLRQRLRDGSAQCAEHQAFGERVYRLDLRHRREALFIDHAIRVDDLQGAVEHLRGAGDITLRTDRHQLLQIGAVAAEIGQHHVAGLIAGVDEIGRARMPVRWRTVAIDRHLERHHRADHGFADLRPRAAVDHAGRHVQQQVHQPWRIAAVEQVTQQLVLLGTDAGQARRRREQGIEQGRTHGGTIRYSTAGSTPGCIHGRILPDRRLTLAAARAI